MSRPFNWHCVASSSCVKPSSLRRLRTCGPTIFAGVLVLAIGSENEPDRNQKPAQKVLHFLSNLGRAVHGPSAARGGACAELLTRIFAPLPFGGGHWPY